ncbi:MAG: HDOD domain-containing protein [Proteobacteria bacterium]|nr:HDOD domain-containing protein [Pseudomonadota bacterium]
MTMRRPRILPEAPIDTWCQWAVEASERHQGDLPVFPLVAVKLLELLEGNRDAAVSEVEKLVRQDPSLLSQILDVANSALFASAMPVETAADAIMRLGLDEAADIVLAAAAASIYNVDNRLEYQIFADTWKQVWRGALGGAYVGRYLCRELKCGDAHRAFLAGLFRDVGTMLLLKLIARGVVQGELLRPPASDRVAEMASILGGNLGAGYLRRSRLPDFVVEVAESRFSPVAALVSDDVHIVRIADGFCDKLGIGPFPTFELGPLAEDSLAALDVDESQLEQLEVQAESLVEQVVELF